MNNSNAWLEKSKLPHKLFPVLIIGESASVLLPIILWYWCYGRPVSDDVNSILDHANCLTDAYGRYDRGNYLTVSENLHNTLDNYLQFFIYFLTTRARSTYISFIVKWLCLVFILCGWVVGQILIHKNFEFAIFRDKFICLYNTGVQNVATCTISTSTYMRAVWFINMVVTSVLIIATVAYVIDLLRPKLYEKTFLYHSVPGCMDRRLALCVNKFYKIQYVSLIAKFCEMNSHILYDVGRCKTLARKYALLEGISPGRESIVDRHYPVIQPYQLDKFAIQSELHFLNIQPKTAKQDNTNKKERDEKANKAERHSKLITKRKRKIEPNSPRKAEKLRYMPHHILNRSLYKFAKESPRSLDQSPITNRSNQSRLTLEDLEFKTSTPENRTLSRSFMTSLESSKIQGKRFSPNATRVYPINSIRPMHPAARTRELDPYAYRLYTSILRRNAETSRSWKP